MSCKICGSFAINHHCHGRDGSDADLCDVCYWHKRAESTANAPWLTLAHTICSNVGILPGEITHRLEQLEQAIESCNKLVATRCAEIAEASDKSFGCVSSAAPAIRMEFGLSD